MNAPGFGCKTRKPHKIQKAKEVKNTYKKRRVETKQKLGRAFTRVNHPGQKQLNKRSRRDKQYLTSQFHHLITIIINFLGIIKLKAPP